MRVAHGAAHDAAKHIAAPFVRRQHAVGDQEARGAQVIGDDARARLVDRPARTADMLVDARDQRLEEIDVEVVGDALQDGGDALKPHAGIDGRLGQIDPRRLVDLLELHEDEVPELQEAIAVFLRRARRAADDRLALIVEDLRAIAARADRAHGPEIFLMPDDSLVRQAGDLLPKTARHVVARIDRHPEPVLRKTELLGDEVPGELDCTLLEVVPEGEVAEHLEEGVVARGVADIVEVVVLAAGAHDLLRGDRARVRRLRFAGEIVLELDHAGIGEYQRRVVARDERPGRHAFVPLAGEVVQELQCGFR